MATDPALRAFPQDLPDAIDEVDQQWRPSSELDVERALRGLDRLAARFMEVQRMAVEWRADISDWEQRQLSTLSLRATAINMALEHWATEQRALSGGRTKSWTFPSGSIDTNKARSKTIVEDEAEAIEWCAENLPSAVKVETSLLKSVVVKACEQTKDGRFVVPDTGEVVPGIRQQVLPDSAVSATVKLASQRALPRGTRDE